MVTRENKKQYVGKTFVDKQRVSQHFLKWPTCIIVKFKPSRIERKSKAKQKNVNSKCVEVGAVMRISISFFVMGINFKFCSMWEYTLEHSRTGIVQTVLKRR